MDVDKQKIQAKIPRRATAIPLRSLGETQLLTVKKAAALIERGSVLVGALPGASLEDLRPLFLRQGRLHVLRVISAAGVLEGDTLDILQRVKPLGIGGAEFFVDGDRCWYIRPFYQTLLWESEAGSLRWEPRVVQQAITGIFHSYLRYAEHGGLHGRIAPQNVAVHEQQLVLVDAGAFMLANGVSGDGLHLSDGLSVLQEADLAGLARVLLDYFSTEQLGELAGFLQTVSEEVIGKGVVLEKVQKHFTAEFKRPGIIVSNASTAPGAARGRILPGGMNVVPGEPTTTPAAEIAPSKKQSETPIPLTEDTVVADTILPGESSDAKPVSEERALTAEEVLKWAENTTSLSRDVVTQIRSAVQSGVPEDRDSNPFLDESLAELERRTMLRTNPRPTRYDSADEPLEPRRSESVTVSNEPEKNSSGVLLALLAVCLVASFLYVTKGPEFFASFFAEETASIDYAAYWQSNLPSKMQQVVARAVIEGDTNAEITIIQDVIAGNKRPNVRSELLKIAFSPLWEQNLSPSDRKLALLLGLPNLIPKGDISVPALAEAHPGVILAALANLPLEEDVGAVARIPLKVMAPLPSPFRESFAVLEALGIQSFSALPARALVRLTLGITIPESMVAFLNGADSVVATVGYVRILYGLVAQEPFIAEVLPTVASETQNEHLQGVFSWFELDPLELWKQTTPTAKMAIFSGMFSEVGLGLAQFSDLLRFPLPHVRQQAIQSLQNMPWARGQQKTIAQLGMFQEEGGLTRTGVISLILALSKPEAEQDSLIGLWFSTDPSPQEIFELLLTRDPKKEDDSFSLEAARYLKDKDFSWTLEQKKKLSAHREMLVRALVYTRLDPENAKEMAILENMREVEPNSFLRKQLDLKLDEFKGTFEFTEKVVPTFAAEEPPKPTQKSKGFTADLAP